MSEEQTITEQDRHYGKDCPKGMVQIEFVGVSPKERIHEYGYKPTNSAFIEVYVDGQRFRIDVGTDYRGKRGIHICANSDIEVSQQACNALSISYKASRP